MALACPMQLVGVIEGVYYFDAQFCGTLPGRTLVNDTRDHTLGEDCSNILDPITVPDTERQPHREECASACVLTGLTRYTSLRSTVVLRAGFEITAEHLVRYEDEDANGQRVERLARLFVIRGNGALRKRLIRIGQELAPGTELSGPLRGKLEDPFGHHQIVATDKGLFHVVTKSYLRPVPVHAPKQAAKKRGGKRRGY